METFVSHFQHILNNFDSSSLVAQEKMLEAIPQIVTPKEKKMLNKPISMEEVKTTLFSMNLDKSLALDGFKAFFY